MHVWNGILQVYSLYNRDNDTDNPVDAPRNWRLSGREAAAKRAQIDLEKREHEAFNAIERTKYTDAVHLSMKPRITQ